MFAGWYRNYLGGRNLNLSLHGEVIQTATSTGFPQGGVCSAKFWLLAFNPAIEIINQARGVVGVGYADDCCILAGGPRVDHLISRVQPVLDKLVDWGKLCNLKFNASKTISIVFSRKKTRFSATLCEYGRAEGGSL